MLDPAHSSVSLISSTCPQILSDHLPLSLSLANIPRRVASISPITRLVGFQPPSRCWHPILHRLPPLSPHLSLLLSSPTFFVVSSLHSMPSFSVAIELLSFAHHSSVDHQKPELATISMDANALNVQPLPSHLVALTFIIVDNDLSAFSELHD